MPHPLTDAERRVAEQVLAEEGASRRHVVVALSGAHAYGFPSPDSDLDLKAIHLLPTADLLGLTLPRPVADRLEVREGVEIDYSSNELGPALQGILKGNGNYLERVLGPHLLHQASEHAELAALARGALSRRVFRHYHGFASGQLAELDAAPEKAAKRVLYVLRTALTGAHLLATGELVTDLGRLAPEHGFGDAVELIAAKRAGERVPLGTALFARWRGELDRALAHLDDAHATSPLPAEPRSRAEISAWLVEVRRAHF
jgi:predicted nucleotidyltransferase